MVLDTKVNLQRGECFYYLFEALWAHITAKVVYLLVKISKTDELGKLSESFNARPLFSARVLCFSDDYERIAICDQTMESLSTLEE